MAAPVKPVPLDLVAPHFARGLTFPSIAKALKKETGRLYSSNGVQAAIATARRNGDVRFAPRQAAKGPQSGPRFGKAE
jgi:hypothetical protein